MHLFTAHRPHTRRYFANFDLPLNPICWAFGHRARGEVKEYRFNIPPSLFLRCRWCDARYTNPDATYLQAREGGWTKEKAEAHEAQRLEVFARDPRGVERSASGRVGYPHNRLELSAELVDRRHLVRDRGLTKLLLDNLGFKLHLGDRGSETPIDGHVDLGLVAAYWSIGGVGGRLAEALGRGQKRNLALHLHGGSLWWELWHDDEGGNADNVHRCDGWRQPKVWPWSAGRRKHRGWMCLRKGNIELNPLDALWGRPRPTRTPSEPRDAFVQPEQFPGDSYLVRFTLEHNLWAREHGPSWVRRRTTETWSVEWDARPAGIPVRNHDWKGDEILAGAFPLGEGVYPGDVGEWLPWAAEHLLATVRRDRERYGYLPPKVQS